MSAVYRVLGELLGVVVGFGRKRGARIARFRRPPATKAQAGLPGVSEHREDSAMSTRLTLPLESVKKFRIR